MLWDSCPVPRLHRQTVEPLPPPTCVVSSSANLFGWTDHGAVTASNGANTKKMWLQQGQNDQTHQRRGLFSIWDDLEVILDKNT